MISAVQSIVETMVLLITVFEEGFPKVDLHTSTRLWIPDAYVETSAREGYEIVAS